MPYEDMPGRWRQITGTDPSWMTHIITVLQRDHRDAWEAAISAAVSENAARLERRHG